MRAANEQRRILFVRMESSLPATGDLLQAVIGRQHEDASPERSEALNIGKNVKK